MTAPAGIIVPALLIYPGRFQLSTGPLTVTEDDLVSMYRNFLAGPEEVPVQLDHSRSVRDTVGQVLALRLGPGQLFAHLAIEGAGNVNRIQDRRFRNVSFGGHRDPARGLVLDEVSIVWRGALPNARIAARAAADAEDEDEYEALRRAVFGQRPA